MEYCNVDVLQATMSAEHPLGKFLSTRPIVYLLSAFALFPDDNGIFTITIYTLLHCNSHPRHFRFTLHSPDNIIDHIFLALTGILQACFPFTFSIFVSASPAY